MDVMTKQRSPQMGSRVVIRLLALVALVGSATASTPGATGWAASVSAPTLTVVASGLNNPRKLSIGPDGALYVAEAGTGGTTCRGTCYGHTASVTQVKNGRQRRVVTGLISAANPTGIEAEGAGAVLVDGDRYLVLLQNMGIDENGANTYGRPMFTAGDLISTPPGRVKPHVIADFGVYEARHNPDRGAGPGPKLGQPPIDSNPNAFVRYGDGYAVADSAGNDLLLVDQDGSISTLAVFPTQPIELTKREVRQIRKPSTFHTLRVQSVPTCVTVGPDGALYLGELTGWPFRAGKARVWRVEPGHAPTVFADGFTTISDIAFAGDRLLVLEMTTRGLLDASSPGSLISVSPGGKRTVVLTTGLASPTGLAVGTDRIYIANHGSSPGAGPEPHGEIVSLPLSALPT